MTIRTAVAFLFLFVACALGFPSMVVLEEIGMDAVKILLIPSLILTICGICLLVSDWFSPKPAHNTK